jgi:hypothetical protein
VAAKESSAKMAKRRHAAESEKRSNGCAWLAWRRGWRLMSIGYYENMAKAGVFNHVKMKLKYQYQSLMLANVKMSAEEKMALWRRQLIILKAKCNIHSAMAGQ